jgi:hypothetical protein
LPCREAVTLSRPALSINRDLLLCQIRNSRERQEDGRESMKKRPGGEPGRKSADKSDRGSARGIRQEPLPCLICGVLAVTGGSQSHGR